RRRRAAARPLPSYTRRAGSSGSGSRTRPPRTGAGRRTSGRSRRRASRSHSTRNWYHRADGSTSLPGPARRPPPAAAPLPRRPPPPGAARAEGPAARGRRGPPGGGGGAAGARRLLGLRRTRVPGPRDEPAPDLLRDVAARPRRRLLAGPAHGRPAVLLREGGRP